jgi:antirestriction protein ArdC
MKNDKIYEMMTDRILTLLDAGTVPWRKPWKGGGLPVNLVSKKAYRGINIFLLSCAGYSSPYWLSFKQAKQKGGKVKKGEKGSQVIFWKFLEKDGENAAGETITNRIPLLRYYTVFNLDQCEGIENPDAGQQDDSETREELIPIEAAQAVVEAMQNPPTLTHEGAQACYIPALDHVKMVDLQAFENAEEYYSTLFHELGHSTGHETRCNRAEIVKPSAFRQSHSYSKEELVAEFTACFLCGLTGIEAQTIDNSAAYIEGWSKKLRSNSKWAVQAAAAAQKAADYICNISFEAREETKPAAKPEAKPEPKAAPRPRPAPQPAAVQPSLFG